MENQRNVPPPQPVAMRNNQIEPGRITGMSKWQKIEMFFLNCTDSQSQYRNNDHRHEHDDHEYEDS
jgi:hypothetical protein